MPQQRRIQDRVTTLRKPGGCDGEPSSKWPLKPPSQGAVGQSCCAFPMLPTVCRFLDGCRHSPVHHRPLSSVGTHTARDDLCARSPAFLSNLNYLTKLRLGSCFPSGSLSTLVFCIIHHSAALISHQAAL